MADSRARLTLKATGQIAAIYADIVQRTGDFAIADTVFERIESQIEALALNPGLGVPEGGDAMRFWVYAFDGFVIEYVSSKGDDFDLEIVAVLRKPPTGH